MQIGTMQIGIDASHFVYTDEEPESDTDIQRLHYSEAVSQLDREDVLMAVLDAMDSDTSPLYDLIDDELGYHPTLPGERVSHNVMVWQKIGQAIHGIVAQQVQAKVQVRMAVPVPKD